MLYNFAVDNFHTKKFCSRLSSSEVRFYTENGRFAFVGPFGGLGATYELFSLGVTAEALRANVGNRRFRFNRGRLTQKFR